MPTRQQIESHRRDLATLIGIAENDLRLLFRQFDTAETAREALRDVLPQLVAIYGPAAATLGADWYDELRESDGARGRFRAIPAELPDQGRTDALARWATSAGTTMANTLALTIGGTQRIITDADRQTITGSALADPASAGWKRIGTGACAFCRMLIERDELYTEATAGFASHDNCNCQAYPQIRGAEPVNVREYVQTERNITDADRARVREYLRTH